jgi:4-amino-4-deoxychorismate lyase
MSAPLKVLVDGGRSDASWPLDRGLHFGDGLFETMLVRNGRARFESLHRERLAAGCERLRIEAQPDAIWHEVESVAAATGSALLKLIVTRGLAMERGYTPTGREKAQRILLVYAAAADDPLEMQAEAVRLRSTLGENPLLAGIKHCNRLEQVLGRAELKQLPAFEGLMASSSGRLISGTMSNVFLVLEGKLVTPRVDRCGIAGITRRVVMREARAMSWAATEMDIPFEATARCSEAFITNSRLGVRPLTSLDGRALVIGENARELQRRISGQDE